LCFTEPYIPDVDIEVAVVSQERKRTILSSSSSSSQKLSFNVAVTSDKDFDDTIIKLAVFAPPRQAKIDSITHETYYVPNFYFKI